MRVEQKDCCARKREIRNSTVPKQVGQLRRDALCASGKQEIQGLGSAVVPEQCSARRRSIRAQDRGEDASSLVFSSFFVVAAPALPAAARNVSDCGHEKRRELQKPGAALYSEQWRLRVAMRNAESNTMPSKLFRAQHGVGSIAHS